LLHDGKVDVALIHRQGGAREAFNLEPFCGVVLGANPTVGLGEGDSVTNLGEKFSNLASNSLVIRAVRTTEFVGQDVVTVQWEWIWNYIEDR
jgi:hypothetical protein